MPQCTHAKLSTSLRTSGGPCTWLAYHVRTADGAAARSVNPLDPKYARKIALWKKLPLPIANLIGPHLSRGLG